MLRGEASFNILEVSYAIRNEDKQVESSEIHSKEYGFPIHMTHRNCNSTALLH